MHNLYNKILETKTRSTATCDYAKEDLYSFFMPGTCSSFRSSEAQKEAMELLYFSPKNDAIRGLSQLFGKIIACISLDLLG